MEKLVGLIIEEPFLQWHIEAIRNIENLGFKVKIFLSKKTSFLNFKIKLLLFLEKNILRTNVDFIMRANSKQIQKLDIIYFEEKVDLLNYKIEFENLNYIFSFSNSFEKIFENFSEEVKSRFVYFDINGNLIEKFIGAYTTGQTVFTINLIENLSFKNKVYTTTSAIENGLLFKSLNSKLAKISLFFARYLRKNTNVKNIEISDSFLHYSNSPRSLFKSFFFHLFDKIYYKRQWLILYNADAGTINEINNFSPFLPTLQKFYADPFIFPKDNSLYLFFEEMNFKDNKGYISYCEIVNNKPTEPKKIIEASYHLSFPNVFEHEGEIFMVPETLADNSIQLWKCNSFPDKWTLEKKLLENIKAVDTIFHQHNGKWFMFCSIKPVPHASGHEELHIFYSDEIVSSNWVSHPKNPVISDARCGRNAGKIENKDDKIFRYGQYSGDVYGKAITRSQIIKLSETEYEEKLLEVVYPESSKEFDNLHSYNNADNFAVSDALRRVKRFW